MLLLLKETKKKQKKSLTILCIFFLEKYHSKLSVLPFELDFLLGYIILMEKDKIIKIL